MSHEATLITDPDIERAQRLDAQHARESHIAALRVELEGAHAKDARQGLSGPDSYTNQVEEQITQHEAEHARLTALENDPSAVKASTAKVRKARNRAHTALATS